jgi:hypothetical protein
LIPFNLHTSSTFSRSNPCFALRLSIWVQNKVTKESVGQRWAGQVDNCMEKGRGNIWRRKMISSRGLYKLHTCIHSICDWDHARASSFQFLTSL